MRIAIPPLPQNVFMAWCFVKHRDNFIFYGKDNPIIASCAEKYRSNKKHTVFDVSNENRYFKHVDLFFMLFNGTGEVHETCGAVCT
jgi:hypothetical protein